MLNELAYAQGVEDGLAKFAVLSSDDLRRMERIYGGAVSPARLNSMIRDRINISATQSPTPRGPIVGGGNPSPLDSRIGPAPQRPVKPVVPAGPTEQTFVPGVAPKITAPTFVDPHGLTDPSKTVNARIPGTPGALKR